jgi:hypothetical protein
MTRSSIVLLVALVATMASAQAGQSATPESVPDSVKARGISFLSMLERNLDPTDDEFPPRDGIGFPATELAEFISKNGVLFTEANPKLSSRAPRGAIIARAQGNGTRTYFRLAHLGYIYHRHRDLSWTVLGSEYEASLDGWYKVGMRIEHGTARVVRIDYLKSESERQMRRAN